MVTEQRKIQHLFWRAGFGPSYNILEKGNKLSLKRETEKLFTDSKENVPLKSLTENYPTKTEAAKLSKEERDKVRRQENQLLVDLNNNNDAFC